MKTNASGIDWHRWLFLASLMLAGESIYLLPYLRKSFQTSMEEAFQINAVELGVLNAMFGVLALISYFPGGWLADRFSARNLLTFSLLSTGAGAIIMLAQPSYAELLALHAFWGVTSILTFWAALIKATRAWGGAHEQGLSFGLLDGGRGVVAAILVSIAATAFAYADTPTDGLTNVILVYACSAFLAGCVVWAFVPKEFGESSRPVQRSAGWIAPDTWQKLQAVILRRDVWLLACIIFCAYFLFLGTYDFPAYAERGFGQSKIFGAQLAVVRDWLRPVAAIAAGLIADRFRPSDTIAGAFALLVLSYGALCLTPANPDQLWLLWISAATAALAVFALRGVYFAVMQQTQIPMTLTGTTVGFVSMIGFVPDIFAAVLSGWFVVNFPDGEGYRYYFALLTLVAFTGLCTTLAVSKRAQIRAAT